MKVKITCICTWCKRTYTIFWLLFITNKIKVSYFTTMTLLVHIYLFVCRLFPANPRNETVSWVFITVFIIQSFIWKYHRLLIEEYIFHGTKTFSPKPHAKTVRCGVRTHALQRVSELKSDALDHSANLTVHNMLTSTLILRGMILRASFPN